MTFPLLEEHSTTELWRQLFLPYAYLFYGPTRTHTVLRPSGGKKNTDHQEMPTIVFSISNPGLDCTDVVDILQQLGVVASVTPNTSIVKTDDQSLRTESGCRVLLPKMKRENAQGVWTSLQDTFGLGCGHVSEEGGFSGCTNTYFT